MAMIDFDARKRIRLLRDDCCKPDCKGCPVGFSTAAMANWAGERGRTPLEMAIEIQMPELKVMVAQMMNTRRDGKVRQKKARPLCLST